ncbi:MAG TPA: hypothetical protein VIY48_21460, partial [Candidatus Paceibacterota bacterium]
VAAQASDKSAGGMDFSKTLLALIIVIVTLLIIERTAPQYADAYIVIIILGWVVANSGALQVFASQIQGRL